MAAGPLSGVTVVDLTRALAGPYCTMVLSNLGARVIKVEEPERGDVSRDIGPFIKGRSAYFISLNRGKESIALDLKDRGDRAVFEKLLSKADVLVENFRAGTLDKLGYGWPRLHEAYPALIYAAASGFGQSGPYANRPAYDMVVQGMGGIMSITGQPGDEPVRVGASVGDIAAGLFAAIGIASALYQRETGGEGMMIDISMLDCQIAILENAVARYGATGEIPGPLGSRHPLIAPFEAFVAGDGRHIIVAAGNEDMYRRLCDVIDRPDLATDPRFGDNEARTASRDALKVEIETALAADDSETWLERLDRAGIPSGPINDIAQAIADPQVLARNMVVDVEDDVAGMLRLAGNPVKISAYGDPSCHAGAPELDGDRDAILRLIEVSE